MKVQIHSLHCSCSAPAVPVPAPSFGETGYDLHPWRSGKDFFVIFLSSAVGGSLQLQTLLKKTKSFLMSKHGQNFAAD